MSKDAHIAHSRIEASGPESQLNRQISIRKRLFRRWVNYTNFKNCNQQLGDMTGVGNYSPWPEFVH